MPRWEKVVVPGAVTPVSSPLLSNRIVVDNPTGVAEMVFGLFSASVTCTCTLTGGVGGRLHGTRIAREERSAVEGIGLHRHRDCLTELVPLRIAGRDRDVGRAGRPRRSLEHEHGLVADLLNRHVLHDDVVDWSVVRSGRNRHDQTADVFAGGLLGKDRMIEIQAAQDRHTVRVRRGVDVGAEDLRRVRVVA